MINQQIKQRLKEKLKEAFADGYTAKSQDEALDNLSSKLATEFEVYFDARVEQINQEQGNIDTGLRSLFGQLIDELKTQSIVMGTNLNKTTLNNIKTQLQ